MARLGRSQPFKPKLAKRFIAAQYSLSAAAGSFTLTGNAATFKATRLLSASVGSFVESGIAAGFNDNHHIVADAGAFALTGNAARLIYQRLPLAVSAGGFTLTGVAAALSRTWVLTAATGSFVLTGNAAAFVAPTSSVPSIGASGGVGTTRRRETKAAPLARQRLRELTLIAGVGRFALVGHDAELLHVMLTREQQIARRKKASEAIFLMLAA